MAIGICMIALAKVVSTMGLQYIIIPGSNTIGIVLVLYGRPILFSVVDGLPTRHYAFTLERALRYCDYMSEESDQPDVKYTVVGKA